MLQFRFQNYSDNRFYNPDRDIGHLLPKLLTGIFGRAEKLEKIKEKYPYLHALFQNYPITVDDFVKIAESVGKYVILTLKDRECRTPAHAMEKAGFYTLEYPQFVIFLAMLGAAILDVFFVALREKYAIGEYPVYLRDYLDQLLK